MITKINIDLPNTARKNYTKLKQTTGQVDICISPDDVRCTKCNKHTENRKQIINKHLHTELDNK